MVIPCFNAGQHLAEAVESGLAQSYKNLEIVIVDDGSTDAGTLSLLEQAQWPRTRIFHQVNAGPSAARNHAIREARGDYILPLDADDTIEPTYAEKAVAAIEAQSDIGCVYCKAMKFGAESGPWDLPPYALDELVIDNVVFVTALFRKSDWEKIGGFDERLRHGVEDYDFWVKMAASGKEIVQLNEYLFNYRVQEKSRTTRFQDGVDSKVSTYADIFRSNKDFFAKHAEHLFRHRFRLYAELEAWRTRCEKAERENDGLSAQWQARYQALEARAEGELGYWKARYGELDAFLGRHASLRKAAGRLKTLVKGR